MTQRNNIPIKYKGQTIWTNARLLRAFTLLLLGDLKNADSSCDLVLQPFYIEFNFESIFSDELELKKVKESIARTNSRVNKDDLIANHLGQRIGAILKSITPHISNRELSKQVTEVTRIRPGTIRELFIQIERLLNEEEPFRTDEQISINYLLGRWKSRTIVDALDFDINFNMTDLSPSQEVMLKILRADNNYSIHISVPAMDWSTNKTLELKLMDGRVVLDRGMLKITESADSKTSKMPIIRADNGQLETYLFKTKIIFDKVSMD
ncbi:MAG: hypothetical protein DI538_12195 [Azospira oryzae]|jgi:hypothetical protein|nr:MAG: hypothetical protein DI538_12195 [Azospira oryzae]